MWIRLICFAAIFAGLAPQAKAVELHRISCAVVRFYVAKYSVSAAETWARSKGATEAEIEAARRCIKDSPVRTASGMSSAFH
jgi:histone acetyltransferase (RNA polymerase elongator complex component)